ncbi:hypothetical protein D9C73_006032 [Collichthys lucidus]|uniref:Uncharacterized protein n=1 Tax=Collichthys lucidus TaxID=240159 RepID=A0A4U5UC68_COLLU|nr:hypothetical protein D9C73_006032 [Collichthys lucidus]
MKRKSTEISSYFKKEVSTVGEREQQRLSEEEKEEDGGEEQTEQHEVTQAQPASVREHSDEEEPQKTADQGQEAPSKAGSCKSRYILVKSRAAQAATTRTDQGDMRRCFSKDW